MCNPLLGMMAVTAIASVGSAVVSHNAQAQSAEMEGAAIKRNTELQQMDSARQQDQMAVQGSEEMNSAARRAMADMASLDAIAQEYGGGSTVDRTKSIQSIQSDEQLATIRSNARGGIFESAFQASAARERSQSQLASIRTPSQAGTYLQIGGALAGIYTDARKSGAEPFKLSKDGGLKVSYTSDNYRGATLPNSLRGGQ